MNEKKNMGREKDREGLVSLSIYKSVYEYEARCKIVKLLLSCGCRSCHYFDDGDVV